ncbi:MAG: peptidylprolyl isomerase [Gammaproteobacteria bacterium]|nr:peptidylprolyl isomerase [Gammaproteobacteria bacterium]
MMSVFRWILLCCLAVFSTTGLAQTHSTSPVVKEIDHIVAVANDDVITYTELEKRVRLIKQQLQQRQAKLPPDDVLRKQVLEQLIMERLQLQVAQQVGIRVDDETINQVINNIAQENKFTLEQFREVLAREGYNFADFRQNIKKDITLNQLRKRRVENRVTVTEQEVDNYLINMANRGDSNDEFHLAHILIAVPEAASPDQIQAAKERAKTVLAQLRLGADFAETAIAVSNGQKALEGGDLGWRKAGQLPTLFSESVIGMQVGQMSELIRSPSGFHIIKLLDRRSKAQRHTVQQTLARHILKRPNEVISNAEAKQRITRLYDRIQGGADFGQLARATSDDTGSAVEGGSLGWVNPGVMVPEFEEQMNKLQPGQISPPFESQFGWHIVQVMARRQQDNTQQFERTQARQQIGRRKSEAAVESWLREMRSEAYVEYRLNQ